MAIIISSNIVILHIKSDFFSDLQKTQPLAIIAGVLPLKVINMRIWVDADACPKIIKEVLFRAANRTQLTMTFVANQAIYLPPSPYLKLCVVAAGFDVADNQIVNTMEKGDLVITADIPLADAVITKGGTAINPRGEMYTHDNIKQRLSIRNFSENLRNSGTQTGGPAKLDKKDIQAFANSLDRFLTRHHRWWVAGAQWLINAIRPEERTVLGHPAK